MVICREGDSRSGQEHLVELKLENPKELHSVIKALMFRETGVIDVSENGLRVVVDDQNCFQAIAYVKNELFLDYVLRQSSVTFRVPLNIISECLNMFGSSNTVMLKLIYDGHGSPLKLMVEKDGVVVKCLVRTLNPDVILDFDFDTLNLSAKIIMKPLKLRETFQDLDTTCSAVKLMIKQHVFSIATIGDYGEVQVDFPQHSEQIEKMECSSEATHHYRYNLLKRMIPSLGLCSKVSLRIDQRGILSMQFMIETSDNHNIFIEFFCVPDVEYSDQEETSAHDN
ncbi:hypothetical protein AB6A40_002869 [Gnathostoma spinigerum]|uniref:Cell cycle checkpoint protein RAD1 n=1 Tax=Gnathostoma spinigerum TaxID=75299 RepID=A0ABD6E7U4_9BILA